ncbi:MAG: YXWGXW repeat-containing protein [Planctomycetes bacterium]|nr:YXWGXW repeat-containing protein [Planctomycetota bacterium]
MKLRLFQSSIASAAVAVGVTLFPISRAFAQGGVDVRVGVGSQDRRVDVEVLTRGPVHEAFAQTAIVELEPPPSVRHVPPPPVPEVPPEEIVDFGNDADVVWIPGYWAWDDDLTNYIWVSGVWRVPPPACEWVPGYWTETAGAWIYTPGTWLPADDDDGDEIEYLPTPPPPPADAGPPIEPPSAGHVWVPGTWYWEANWGYDVDTYRDPRTGREVRVYQKREAGYVWRPGYWMVARPDWVWSPATYVWTPRGYIFIDGHWDYPIDRRGVLFAPVTFSTPVAAVREYHYSPSFAIDVSVVVDHMFLQVHTGSYYFGDYYAVEYSQAGFCPWFESAKRVHVYDPFYTQTRTHFVKINASWESDLRRDFEFRVAHVDARPARTLRLQETRIKSISVKRDADGDRSIDVRKLTIAKPMAAAVRASSTHVQLKPLSASRRAEMSATGGKLASFLDKRREVEGKTTLLRRGGDKPDAGGPSVEVKSQRVKIERSPLGGRSPEAIRKAPEKPRSDDAPAPKKLRNLRKKAGDDDKPGEKRIKRQPKDKDDDKP